MSERIEQMRFTIPGRVEVEKGDTLEKIARENDTTREILISDNPHLIENDRLDPRRRDSQGNWIYPGDVVLIVTEQQHRERALWRAMADIGRMMEGDKGLKRFGDAGFADWMKINGPTLLIQPKDYRTKWPKDPKDP